MRITLSDLSREVAYDVSGDIQLQDLMCLANVDLGTDPSSVSIFRGSVCVAKSDQMSCKISDVGIVDGDLLVIVPSEKLPTAPSTNPQVVSADKTSSDVVLSASVLQALASIKVKPKKSSDNSRVLEGARQMFAALKDPATRGPIYYRFRDLFDQWNTDPDNFEAFVVVYKRTMERLQREARLKSDPLSEEGQRLIQEDINRERIAHSYQHTMEHHPEYMVRTHMLYIDMEINKYKLKAFVDSGAQVSIMSEDCARRCSLIDLIDRNFRSVARGVGGNEEIIGRIHGCDVKIENHHFACTFEVMKNRDVDILFGLNVLRIHQCNINLKHNRLEMGDGTMTSFLSEAEVTSIQERSHDHENSIADDAELTSKRS